MKNTTYVLLAVLVSGMLENSAFAASAYVIRRGDTLLKISDRLIGNEGDRANPRRYQMSRQILKMNPQLKDPNTLTIGESLNLPGGPAPASETSPKVANVTAPAPTTTTEEKATESKPAELPSSEVKPAEPAPEVVGEAERKEHHRRFLMIQPRFQMNDYEVENKITEEHLKLHSKLVAGIGLAYGKALGEKTHLVFKVGVNYAELGKFTDDANSLDNRLQWVKNFGVGIEYHWFHSLKVELMAMYNDHLFILPEGANAYTVANVAMPGAELVFDWSFFQASSYALGLTAAAEYAGKADQDDVKYELAIEPVASLYFQSDCPGHHMNYRVAAVYTMSGQSPEENIEQEVKSFGLNLSLLFPF